MALEFSGENFPTIPRKSALCYHSPLTESVEESDPYALAMSPHTFSLHLSWSCSPTTSSSVSGYRERSEPL